MYLKNSSLNILNSLELNAAIEVCIQYSDYFSLTIFNSCGADTTLEELLNPYLYKKLTDTHWFCYYTMENNPLNVNIYPVCAETTSIIKKYNKSFDFYYENADVKQTLEDICFFKNGKLIFGTVTHEGICAFFECDKLFFEKMLEISSDWQYIESKKEQICL